MLPTGSGEYWGWLANNVNDIALDVRSKIERETRKKYLMIAAGAVGAFILFFIIGRK